jgi:hypothetical protein
VYRWAREIYRSIQAYWHIQELLENKSALERYIQSFKKAQPAKFVDGGILLEDGSVVELPTDSDDFEEGPHTIVLSEEEITANLQEAASIYQRQMIVVAGTYIELILKDFLRAVFCAHPQRMHDFLDDGTGQKGTVSLRLITRAPSLPDLLEDLAERAASNALRGRFKSQLGNLAKIVTEAQVPSNLQELLSIVERRNRIVHEASQEKVNPDEIRLIFDSCSNLLLQLADSATKCGVPLDQKEGV